MKRYTTIYILLSTIRLFVLSVWVVFYYLFLYPLVSSSVKNPLLLCADSLMEVSPVSALSILESNFLTTEAVTC